MSELNKQQLAADNNNSFPNNNTGYITPTILRAFNTNMIDSLVDEISYNADSASFSASIAELQGFSSSLDTNFASQAEFNAYTQSQNFLNGTFATTGSNTFTGNQFISGTNYLDFRAGEFRIVPVGNGITLLDSTDGLQIRNFDTNDLNIEQYAQNDINIHNHSGSIEIAGFKPGEAIYLTASVLSFNGVDFIANSASVNSRLDSSLVTASVSQSTITFTKGDGSTFNITVADISGSAGDFVTTASFNSFTASYYVDSASFDSRLNSVTASIDTSSLATTGSNSFRGQQIVSSSVLIVTSGSGDIESLKLLPYLSSSTYNGYRDLTTVARDRTVQSSVGGASPIYSASVVNPVNIIFGQTNPTFTAQGIVSGSNNILLSTRTNATTGSEGYSANLTYITTWPVINNPFLGNTVRSNNSFLNTLITINLQNNGISASTALGYPNFNRGDAVAINNTGINGTTVVTPSGSAIVLQNNLLYGGTHTFQSPRVDSWTGAEYALNSSSVLNVTNNIINGAVTVTDRNSVRAGGNNTAIQNNLFGGVNMEVVTPVSGTNSTGHVFNTIAYGNGIIVTGSMASQGGGSGVFGRFNANDGIRNALQQNVFIVGTGTNSSNRKTAFLIDSASNVSVEGNLLVSGGNININSAGDITGSNIVSTINASNAGFVFAQQSTGSVPYTFNTYLGRDALKIYQYQGQQYAFNMFLTSDQLNAYTGSQFRMGLQTNGGPSLVDYWNLVSGSNTTGDGSIKGLDFIGSAEVNRFRKGVTFDQNCYFDKRVKIEATGDGGYALVLGGTNSLFSSGAIVSSGTLTVNNSANFGGFSGGQNILDFSSSVNSRLVVTESTASLFEPFSTSVDSRLDTIEARYATTGSNTFNGNQIISGSVTIANTNGNDLYVHGHKQFNAGEFWSTITQSGSAGVSGSITFNTSGSVYGVSIVSSSQVTMENAGVYNIQFSAQIETSAGSDTAYIWFKKNGSNIADSATKVVLANNTSQVMTVNILDTAAANDYYELGYQFTNGNATILAEAASGNIPAIPSVILTVTQAR